jgi:hypothetical protein
MQRSKLQARRVRPAKVISGAAPAGYGSHSLLLHVRPARMRAIFPPSRCSVVSMNAARPVSPPQHRGLTPRSSGAPTAGHQGPVGGTLYIFANRALASCRCRPLSSNVRHPKNAVSLGQQEVRLSAWVEQPRSGKAARRGGVVERNDTLQAICAAPSTLPEAETRRSRLIRIELHGNGG